MPDVKPIRWIDDCLLLLDQTQLPAEIKILEVNSVHQAIQAIKEMRVRGAPAIGVTAAYAVVLAARFISHPDRKKFLRDLEIACKEVTLARPTAVNLHWAVGRMLNIARYLAVEEDPVEALVNEALRIHQETEEADRALSGHGAPLLPDTGGVLTHCNTGSLATGGYGTALGVIRAAWERGKRFQVFVTETRPLMQGARLTTWELSNLGIPATLVVDSAAASLMAQGAVSCVIVGADRIAGNGDVANKIGTYALAVLAGAHGLPVYVAAPICTLDLALKSGQEIPIEERDSSEVTRFGGVQMVPEGVQVSNPAFDITPFRYISGVITECGILRPPYNHSLRDAATSLTGGR
jgi:methylthioribose-1-phosphate isomerase